MRSRYVALLCRRSAAVLAFSALACALSLAAASRLRLRTGLEELLPVGAPAAAAHHEAVARMGDAGALEVMISSPDRAANLDFAARLAPRLEALGPDLVERALYGAPEVRQFFVDRRWLYADRALLEELRARVEQEIAARKNPLLVSLDEPPSWTALEQRADASSGKALSDRFPDGVLTTAKGDAIALVVLPSRRLSSRDDEELLASVRGVVEGTPRPPSLRVSYAGEVAAAVEERHAIAGDVLWSTGIVVLLVALVVWLHFGRLRAVPLMALPALAGATVALGAAGLLFGALNTSTAFLGSIIVGNGINYPILALARYEEERRRGHGTARALEIAVGATARATLLAAAAASVAYGSLALTSFRGFSQFGVIGGVGMLACWLFTMTLLPALVWRLDRAEPTVAATGRRGGVRFGVPFARAAERAPWLLLAGGVGLSLLAAASLPRWLADPFEYDLRHLGRGASGAPSDGATAALDASLGRALSPSLLLAPSSEAAAEAAATIRARAAKLPPTVARVVTLRDLLPGSLEEQRAKLAILSDIRRRLDDPALALASDRDRARIATLRPPAGLRPLTVEDLPPLVRRPFTERDGTVGRVALVFPPREGFSVYSGRDLLRLADVIGEVPVSRAALGPKATSAPVAHGVGRPVVFAALIRAIASDGPHATLASFLGVAFVTIVLLTVETRRRRGAGPPAARRSPAVGAAMVLGALLLGVLWLLGIAAALDLRLNMLNFVALPITFGIGVDYAANLYLRYREDPARRVGAALASTGGAVALNSLTTIIGYASLLAAHSGALRSFGALAILGELTCLFVALSVLPAALELRRRAQPAPLPHKLLV